MCGSLMCAGPYGADEEPPCKAAVEAGAIPVLIEALQPPQMDSVALETTFQAAWALTNLAVGDSEVVQALMPAAPILIAYVGGDNGLTMAEQCAWAIGNIAEEDVEYRSILISNGAVLPLINLLVKACKAIQSNKGADSQALSAGETAAWALANLFKGEGDEVTAFLETDAALDTVMKCLGNLEIPLPLVREIFWIFSRLTGGNHDSVSILVNNGILKLAAAWASRVLDVTIEGDKSGATAMIPVLRVIGNVASSRSSVVSAFFCEEETGIQTVKTLVICAESSQLGVEREAAWALGCIAGLPGTLGAQIVKKSGGIPILLNLLQEKPFHVKKEAAFALENICAGGGGLDGDSEVINHVFAGKRAAIKSMLELMNSADHEAIGLGLQFASMVLHHLPQGKELIERADGIEILEHVQFAEGMRPANQKAAHDLVDEFWGIDKS